MPTPNQGRIHSSRKLKKKLKNAIGFQSPYLSFINWPSWLIQSVVRTQARKTSQEVMIFQGLRYAPPPRAKGPTDGQLVLSSAANKTGTSMAQTAIAPAITINQRSIRGSRVAIRRCL